MNLSSKLNLACAIVVGSFVLSCGQHMLNGADSNAIPDATAETGMCCAPQAPTYTKLWDGTLSPSTLNSPDIATGAYREVIVYAVDRTFSGCGEVSLRWRPDASTPYGSVTFQGVSSGGRVSVDGSHAMLQLNAGSGCSGSGHYVVAGVI